MNKSFILAALATAMLTSCGAGSLGNVLGSDTSSSSSSSSNSGSILGSIISSATSGETLGNVLSSVLGTDKISESSLHGTWKYSGAGCAFTSENALAKAGGEVAASTVKEKLNEQYSKLKLTSTNTQITFNTDGTFSAKIGGKSLAGTYTFDSSDQSIKLKATLLTLTAYTKKTTSGLAILFESKKALTLLQTLTSLSGNSTAAVIGDISKNYDGVRIGFEMKK